ncbi:MAG: hypothetical protein H6553_04345 [Chitinophagales bacterium]|nr:hypothetical protein [Chitinophagales bacterium]
MNTYKFESGTKSKIFTTLIVGIIILALGFGISALKYKKASNPKVEHVEEHGATEGHAEVAENSHATHDEAQADTHHADNAHGEHEAATVSSPLKIFLANFYALFLYGFFVCVAAIFFLAATTIAWGGWQIQIQKIPLAMTRSIYLFLGLILAFAAVFGHDIFEWMHKYLYDKADPRFDEILFFKSDYLNPTVFWIVSAIVGLLSCMLAYRWWKNLTAQDEAPSLALFSDSRKISAISIVLIAFVISTFGTWTWSMSVQPHWYSTMFPWYTMASAATTMLSIILLLIYFLKSKGLLPGVNANHTHDIAKLMFALSVFWTYVWFDQYMLIWYGNIPEETSFFILRRKLDNYGILFHLTFVINFILPFFILMKRDSKRKEMTTVIMAIILIIGHWMDFYLMVGPPMVPKGGFGLIGLGGLLIIGSIFTYITLWSLSKVKDLSSSTHPYVEESYKHHI